MGKAIKVQDDTRKRLVVLMEYGDSFDKVIKRLLDVYEKVNDLKTTLGPAHHLASSLSHKEDE